MRFVDTICRLAARFRYPITLPEEVAEALGVEVSNFLTFETLISTLQESWGNPMRLARFMPRKLAESAFRCATSKDVFKDKTLISYYFQQGIIEFVLLFDEKGRLRRVYLQHKNLQNAIEIKLTASYIGHRLPKGPSSSAFTKLEAVG